MAPRVVLLADAGPMIGVGHVVRSLSVGAEMKRRGAEPLLLSRDLNDALVARAARLGVPHYGRRCTMDDGRLPSEVREYEPDLIIRDSYSFSEGVVAELDRLGAPSLVIDDNREAPLGKPTALLNQNLHATKPDYADLLGTRLMLGPRWCLIREEVRKLAREASPHREMSVLISTGGSDPLGVRRALADCIGALGVRVVEAPGLMVQSNSSARYERLLAQSTVAVIAAGTSLWEAACLGTPAIAVVTAQNQEALAREGEKAGICRAVDIRFGLDEGMVKAVASELLESKEDRDSMMIAGRALIDGEGVRRVGDLLEEVLRES